MYAIVETGGKQVQVEVGQAIYVEKLDKEVDTEVVFDKVLMIDGEVGNPVLSGATVVGKVLKQGKQRKIRIFKYIDKQKSSRKRQGHRQPYTKVEITKITR